MACNFSARLGVYPATWLGTNSPGYRLMQRGPLLRAPRSLSSGPFRGRQVPAHPTFFRCSLFLKRMPYMKMGMPLLLFLFIQHLPQTPDGLCLSVASIADGLRVYVQIGSVSTLNARTLGPVAGFISAAHVRHRGLSETATTASKRQRLQVAPLRDGNVIALFWVLKRCSPVGPGTAFVAPKWNVARM